MDGSGWSLFPPLDVPIDQPAKNNGEQEGERVSGCGRSEYQAGDQMHSQPGSNK